MLEAEEQVIGSILLDNESLYKIYNKLKPEEFTSVFYRDCYTEMLGLYDRGIEINTVNITMALSDRYQQADINKTLGNCLVNTMTSVQIKDCCNAIKADYKARTVKEILNVQQVTSGNVDDVIADVLTRLEALKQDEVQKSKSLRQIVEENKDNYFVDNNNLEKSVKSGLYELDECIGGFQGGDIYVLGARPSVGKSALALQIIQNATGQGKKVGYFNLEMAESQIYERFISGNAAIEMTRVRRAKTFLNDEKERFDKANDTLSKYNVIVTTGSKTDMEIKAECRHQNYDLIVIDYLQLVRSAKRCESRRVEVGEVSRSLKSLATELNVPVLVLSQLNRKSEMYDDKEPTMAELRETGDIEQDASVIMLMWNLSAKSDANKKYKGLKVDKNRNGELIREVLKFDGSHMQFAEKRGTTIEQQLASLRQNSNDGFTDADMSSVPWE
jgi:replicative DNA helicase